MKAFLLLLSSFAAMEAAQVPVLSVPRRDPEAEAAMRTPLGEAVSGKKAGKFFQIWDALEGAGGTVTEENSESVL